MNSEHLIDAARRAIASHRAEIVDLQDFIKTCQRLDADEPKAKIKPGPKPKMPPLEAVVEDEQPTTEPVEPEPVKAEPPAPPKEPPATLKPAANQPQYPTVREPADRSKAEDAFYYLRDPASQKLLHQDIGFQELDKELLLIAETAVHKYKGNWRQIQNVLGRLPPIIDFELVPAK